MIQEGDQKQKYDLEWPNGIATSIIHQCGTNKKESIKVSWLKITRVVAYTYNIMPNYTKAAL